MKKIFYPAIFHYSEEGGFWISFPDVPECLTEGDDVVVIVPFDIEAYNKKYHSKAVKKTLTIPEWLNDEAIAHNVNFSQVLQDALKQQLNMM